MVRRTRKQRAGKFIGEGVYGCGFTPSLRCKGEVTRRNGLSKMMIDKHSVDEEFEISARIARIDPERKYFLTATGTCEHDQTNINLSVKNSNSAKRESCSKFPLRNKSYLIFYEMGGQNLETLKVHVNKYPAFFRGLEKLFKGLVVLHKGNIVHADIKPDNIVGKLNPDGSYNIRYIDFGVSVPNTQTLSNQSDIVYRTSDHTFRNYPPHYPIDSVKFTKGMNVTSEYLTNWYSFRNQKYPYDNRGIIYHNLYPQKTYWDYAWKMPATTDNIIRTLNQYNDYYARNTKHAMESLDIYGLGMALSMVYSRVTGHYSRIDNYGYDRITVKYKDKETFIEHLPDSFIKAWHKKLADGFSIPFFNVVSEMMKLIGANRPTAEIALRNYQKILVNVDSFFKDSDDLMYSALKMFGADVQEKYVQPIQAPLPLPPRLPPVLPPPPKNLFVHKQKPQAIALPAIYPQKPQAIALPAIYPQKPKVQEYPAPAPVPVKVYHPPPPPPPPLPPPPPPPPPPYRNPARVEVNRILDDMLQKPAPFVPLRNRAMQHVKQYSRNNKGAVQKYLNTKTKKNVVQKYLNLPNPRNEILKRLRAPF